MKPICGIIVAEEKVRVEKEDKVFLFSFLFCTFITVVFLLISRVSKCGI